jgi:uncharacterized protein (TIGR03118 family)
MPRLSTSAKAIAIAAGLFAPPALAGVPLSDAQLGATPAGVAFNIINRVADQPGVAPVTDPLLVNPWGLSQAPGATVLWTSNNGSDTSTLYNTATGFSKVPLNVNVPGAPTGTTFVGINGAFNLSGASNSDTVFAFATEGGQIEGWSPNVDLHNAVVTYDGSANGSEFKGLTLGVSRGPLLPNLNDLRSGGEVLHGHQPLLFAADFGHNVVDAFDSHFNKVASFTDPFLPANYSPFNTQTLNGLLYVTFAQRAPGAHDETAGPGLGFVDVFDTSGHLLHRLVSGGALNAPWGLAVAPASFGKFAGALLVGNFGDGQINAYNIHTGAWLGTLDVGNGGQGIDGLWALHSGPNGTLTFSAGPNEENNGLLGSIAPAGGGAMWGHAEVVSMAEMHH